MLLDDPAAFVLQPSSASFLNSPKGMLNIVLSPYAGTNELTLVVACRDSVSGCQTCELLSKYAEDAVQHRQQQTGGDGEGHAQKFLQSLKIDFLYLDLGSMDSVFGFAEEVHNRYPYISHLFLNAGSLNMEGIDYKTYFKLLMTEGQIAANSSPVVFQRKSTVNKDGLGDIWQENVFGHYCLFRKLESLLRACPFKDARIFWTSSLDRLKRIFDTDDIQLLNTPDTYQLGKHQVNLICVGLSLSEERLNSQAKKDSPARGGGTQLTQILIHPGICSTNNGTKDFGPFMRFMQIINFYMARWAGSVNHVIDPFKGAVSGTFAALTSKEILDEIVWYPLRSIGSRITFWGTEYVGLDSWELEENEASLLKKCFEEIYDGLPQILGST